MLKKLRLKFIFINMTIVTIMIAAVFGLLYYSTSRNLEQESLEMMERISVNPVKQTMPGIMPEDVRLPYFSVELNGAMEPVNVSGGFFDLSDEEMFASLLREALESPTDDGVLEGYDLRFHRVETPRGRRIIFADTSSERSTLKNLVETFAVVGIIAFLGFLGISILLARWAVKPVDQAWKQQKQFIADASHELKTPLTVIMTDAELLNARECPPEDRGKLTDNILTMSIQMRGLVENLLELARIDNGTVREEKTCVDFSEAVSNAAMLFEPGFFEKGLSFDYRVEPDIFVIGCSTQLKQLAEILLDNALKYTSPGGETKLILRRSGQKHCLLTVRDQGEAISEEDLKNLFKRFYRADKARALNHSYGLGLSIAQSVTEQHKGRIWAESRDGYNSFFAELPIQ